jgi:hypothetical protein
LPPGDAPLTKLVKSKGVSWLVQVRKGRRLISKGIWTEAAFIREAQDEVEKKRSTPQYQKRREADHLRKEKKHKEYENDFQQAVLSFLAFDARYQQEALKLAVSVTELATPVGSGTVARTTRIPVEERARAAVIAWLRHQTTSYDAMKIARVKGRRREVRRMLADRSLQLLENYRTGADLEVPCPLQRALQGERES